MFLYPISNYSLWSINMCQDDYIHWREMLDYNKESLNLSRTQCGPFINLQICSLLWLKFEWTFSSIFVESSDQALSTSIKSEWKFWSGFDWKFNFDWKFWSNSSISLVHVISIYPIARVLILLKVCVRSAPTCPWPSSPWSLGLAPEREPGNNSGYKVAAVAW